jgi:hypothetical protein
LAILICLTVYPWKVFPACGKYYKLFTAVIMPLAAYFSMILTELLL